MSAAAELDVLARSHPEWAPWLQVVRVVCSELGNPAWEVDRPLLSAACNRSPLLAGAMLRPDGRAVAQLLHRLASAARAQGLHALVGDAGPAPVNAVDDALALFLAAVNGDKRALDRHARRTGASPEGLHALAQFLPMPYLHACARRWASGPCMPWTQGHCPVCGAWPAFAELRGIERTRHLRCGRCGAGWPMPALACTYCATTDHATLGALVVDGRSGRYSVEVCHGCAGYLKACARLQPTPSDELLVVDLASVEFDLVAVERGFQRPASTGAALQARLAGAGPT